MEPRQGREGESFPVLLLKRLSKGAVQPDLIPEAAGVPIEAKLRPGTPPGQRGAMTRPVLSPAQGRSGVSGRVLPDGHPDPRKAAENRDFFGPLWHMQDIAP